MILLTERVLRITIQVKEELQNCRNMQKNSDLEILPVWKFRNQIRRFPRDIGLAKHADIHLKLKPGTNVAFANGIMNVIISEGLQDDKFIAERTEGYEKIKEIVKDYTPEVKNKVTDVSSTTWQAVHEGMRAVVTSEHKDIFTKLNASGVQLSGKTGTAQQSQTHPDHGLFVGFAPSDSPQIAFAIRIANGYSSTFAAEVGNNVMEYYYKVTPENELITGEASNIGIGSNGVD